MWGTLKKDFGEFVSTVANDATDVLQQLDQGLDASDGEGRESTMLIDPDTGIPIEYDNNEPTEEESSLSNVQNNKTDMVSTNNLPPKPQVATVDEMKAFLMTQDAVFLDVIGTEDDPDATAFLETFDLGTKTEEITNLLETHKDTLEETFSRLIDEVEYADFWQRFFYRIASDEEKLKTTYAYYYDEYMQSMANNKNPTLAAKTALSNVTSFLGGVVHRLVDENNVDDSADEDEEIVDNNDDADDGNVPSRFGSSTSAAVKFLAGSVSGVRPPFVLNTAISDDDDKQERQDKNDDEEEEEEELGWDDDEEEEEEEEEEDQNETVEFKDAEKEKLLEELAQAQEERDMLHKTVTMQSEEIKKLREAIQPEIVAGSNESSQVKILQMQLFEKDAELAALRAQLDDLKNEKDEDENFEAEAAANATAAASEMDRLKEMVAQKDEEIQGLKNTQQSIQEKNSKASAAAAAEMAQELDRLKEEVAAKDREIALLQSSDKTDLSFEAEASAAAAKATRELDQLKEVLAKKNGQLLEAEQLRVAEVADLRSRLENLQTEKDQVQVSLQSQIDDLKRAQDLFSSKAKSDMENVMIQKDGEIVRLQQSLEEARIALQEQASVEDIETICQELVQSQLTIVALRNQLEHTTTILKEREAEVQALKGPPSPGSTSTGIKVSTDAPSQDDSLAVSEPSVPRKNGGGGDGEDDDGWGDDW
ncbi:BSD domain containing protein [Nitzschia inconspicua]|uniref:BSD domain containing protein n=1 Tax=Nitzschia inconspicua TaxID=303405 RepID=A0A9K3LWV1_9STRA|nr:BSD domain containing protein [Nitzschia inconspicua]